MNTPWGVSQEVIKFDRGFVSVSTAGHGGFMLTEKFVKDKELTPGALKRAIKYNNYYCYEEDCDWAIPAFELLQYLNLILKNNKNPMQSVLKTLSYWNADYLEERNFPPEPEAYKKYKERKLESQMRKENHPDLIVAAYGDWHTKIPDVIEVCTANNKRYHVTKDSYHKTNMEIPLLSECEVLKEIL
ncbi:MAG: hypothetical protein KAX49_17690 [Halanaerobiales bacterium]|nr:hypothetical protein [Halanaerobiales bacterium]